ncbi:MAG: DUF421 domain-containing protein [Clostridia bacterium]|nr:DUF421 domain-containing protein [Clostridia bacterium]
MLVIFLRALILYVVVFLVIRLMGKRELSKVQPFELAIIILIADLASGPMSSRAITIFDGIIPIVTLLIAYILFTFFIQSSDKAQNLLCGKISILIQDGKINEDEMKKLQYTVADLMEQLREKDVFKIQDVKYAILETNGKLNVIKNSDKVNNIPLNIIENGFIAEVNIKILGMSEEDVEKLIKKHNLKQEDILLGTIDEDKNFLYQLKDIKLEVIK